MIPGQKDRVTSLSNANACRNWIWWRRTWMEQRWQIQRVFSVRKTTMPAKTSVLLYLVDIVICARNFKHGRMDNQLKKPGEQEPKTCSIRWGWISLAKKGWSREGGTSAGRRRRGGGGVTSKLLNRIHIYYSQSVWYHVLNMELYTSDRLQFPSLNKSDRLLN